MSLTNERLSDTMDFIETRCINPTISKIDQNFYIHVLYHLIVLALVYTGLNSPKGMEILGLGSLNLVSNFKNAKKAWWNFNVVKLELKEIVEIPRAMLLKAGDNEELLKEVARHIDELFMEIQEHHKLTEKLKSLE